jgi:hypothetical protein
MAGTIVSDTLQDGAGNSTATTNAIQGSAKAWVRFDGTTPTITSQYNVSSISKSSAGNYTINYTNALANANYTTVTSCANIGTSAGYVNIGTTGPNGNSNNYSTSNITTAGVKITLFNVSQAQGDSNYITVACYI